MKKTVFSAIISIVLCLSLVVGGTFALFTSEYKTNIAITSGTVDVKAEVTLDSLYSPTLNLDGTVADSTNLADKTFANGGTVNVDGAEIKITNMTPGDKATFKVTVTNSSDVAFMQRITLGCPDEDKAFFNELLIGLSDDGVNYTYYSDFATAWEQGTPITEGGEPTVQTKYITVELPAFVGNKWQEKTATLTLNVKAVQGNAVVTDALVEKIITVVDAAGVSEAIANAADGDVILLCEPVDTLDVAFDSNKEITLRGYKIGTLNVNAPNGTLHVYNNLGAVYGENVAQHTLYVYGEIDSILINRGRVVVENTAHVKEVRIAAAANAKVVLSIPETVVADEVLVGKVDSIIIDSVDTSSNVVLRVSPEIDDEIISGDEQEGVEVVKTTGSSGSYIADDDAKILYIGDEAGLREFADRVNAGNKYVGWTVKLTADIDLGNRPWSPIGYAVVANGKYEYDISPCFAGSLDGQGYTISNLYIDDSTTNIRGLFGYAKLVSVKNLNFHNAFVVGLRRAAVLVGHNDGSMTVDNVHITGDIKIQAIKNEAGTLVARGGLGAISNVTVNANEGSYVKCSTTSNANWEYVGGVWGHAWPTTAENITSNIDVYAYASATGGIGGGCAVNSNNITCTGNVTLAIKDSEIHKGTIQCWQTNGTIYGFGVGSSNAATHTNCTSEGTFIIAGEVITDNALNDVATGYLSNDVRFGAPYYAAGVIAVNDEPNQ